MEVRVLQWAADGLTARQAARDCILRPQTLRAYLYLAGRKLGVRKELPTVGAAYAFEVLPEPPAETGDIRLTQQHARLLPLVIQGKTYAQMALLVGRFPASVGYDFRKLTGVLQAATRPHLVTRQLQYRFVTVEEEVRTWLS
ncbi:hypothetical protein ACFVYR_36010 [Streptomyces sp. NPDC058284]|uniref:hypothetical protein n=1 Tax=unclassified Streptomyces TaxID=2593676 RepID=UPI0036607B0B